MRFKGKLLFGAALGIAIAMLISEKNRERARQIISSVSVEALSSLQKLQAKISDAVEEGYQAAKEREKELNKLLRQDTEKTEPEKAEPFLQDK